MSATTVRLSKEVEQALNKLAERTERSRSWLINRAVEEYLLRDQNERERWDQTLHAIEQAAQGNLVAAVPVRDRIRSWGTAEESGAPHRDS